MESFVKKEVVIVLLYVVFIGVLIYRKESRNVNYLKAAGSLAAVVLVEGILEYAAYYIEEDAYLMTYSVLQWLMMNSIYIFTSLTIYKVCGENELSYRMIWKQLALWIKIGIVVMVVIGAVLSVMDIRYGMELSEQLKYMESGAINYFAALSVDFTSPYYKAREVMRIINIGCLSGGLLLQRKNKVGSM